MRVTVEGTNFAELASLRTLHRQDATCQIVRDSILPRGLADAYMIRLGDRPVGYGGVWNEHFPGRVMEFYLLPEYRDKAAAWFRELLLLSGATQIEAQTNMPRLYAMLRKFAVNETEEHILFEDGPPTGLTLPGSEFRRRRPSDVGLEGEWVVHKDGEVLGAGGILDHYNPPYGDVYMAVTTQARGRGIGRYLVQELRRVCLEGGLIPAARCDPSNEEA